MKDPHLISMSLNQSLNRHSSEKYYFILTGKKTRLVGNCHYTSLKRTDKCYFKHLEVHFRQLRDAQNGSCSTKVLYTVLGHKG